MSCSDQEDDYKLSLSEAAKKAKKQRSNFRFVGKNVGLTFPQCDISMFEFKYAMSMWGSKQQSFSKWVAGREKHEDGKHHFHLYLHYPQKLDTKDARFWDLPDLDHNGWFHPNITKFSNKSTQDQIDKWISYCKKEGEWVQEGFLSNLFTFIHWKDYNKKKRDLAQWEQDSKAQQLIDPFPFSLPNDLKVNKPVKDDHGNYNKKRHWLLLGPPDCGKSHWLNSEFKGKKVHMRPKNEKYGGPFEFNTYNGEQVVLYDDTVPKLDELIDVANIFEIKTQTYGGQRYQNNYWPLGQARVIIWMLNPEQLPEYAQQGNQRYKIFKQRFNFMQWEHPDGIDDPEDVDPVLAWRVIEETPVVWEPPAN